MELIKTELYKVYIKRFFLVFVIVFFLFQIGSTIFAINNSLVLEDEELTAFKNCIAMFGGEISEEKQEKIETLIKENEQIYEEIEKLNTGFAADLISEEEYNEQIGKYNSQINEAEGFNAFVKVYQNALLTNRPIVDTTGWNSLFFDRRIDISLVVIILIMTVQMSVIDEETGFCTLRLSTKLGKEKIYRTQMFILLSTSFILSISSAVLNLFTADLFYGISTEYAPIASVELFSFNESKISITAVYIIVSLLKAFGCSFLALVSLSIGRITKSSLFTAFGTVGLMFLPGYVFAESEVLYFLPMPSSFFMAEGLFRTNLMGNITSVGDIFNAFMTDKSIFGLIVFAVLSVAVFSGLFFWNYCRYKERKRK